MTETNSDEKAFTPGRAIEALAEARGWDESLRRRTGGITWTVWGLASAGIFTSYLAMGALYGSDQPWWTTLVWAPWTIAGVVVTTALWRSSAISAGAREEASGARSAGYALLYTALWGGLIVGAWLVYEPFEARVNEGAFMLIVLGLITSGVGATRLVADARTSRLVFVATGTTLILAGVGATLAGLSHAATNAFAAAAAGATFIAAGVFEALRG